MSRIFITLIFCSLVFSLEAMHKKSKETQSDFWDPKQYNLHAMPQFTWSLSILEEFEFNNDDTILDIGCGNGELSAWLANQVPKGSVLGIDQSGKMVSFAQTRFKKHPNLQFACIDAQKIDIMGEFSLITSFNCLHWIADQEQVLTHIYNHLKPQGRILLHISPLAKTHPIFNSIAKTVFSPSWNAYFPPDTFDHFMPEISCAEYEHLMKKAGFENISCIENEMTTRFTSKEQFIEWFTGWFPFPEQFPQDQKSALIKAIVQNYLNTDHKREGIEFHHTFWIVKAKRNG